MADLTKIETKNTLEYQDVAGTDGVDNVILNSGHGKVDTKKGQDRITVKAGAFFKIDGVGEYFQYINSWDIKRDKISFDTEPGQVIEHFVVANSYSGNWGEKDEHGNLYILVRDTKTDQIVSAVRLDGVYNTRDKKIGQEYNPVKDILGENVKAIELHPSRGNSGISDADMIDKLIARGQAKEVSKKLASELKPIPNTTPAEAAKLPVTPEGERTK